MPEKDKIIEILKTCHDSVLPVNVWDLGLIYELDALPGAVSITMSLTSHCEPGHAEVPKQIEAKLKEAFPDLKIQIDLVFEPEWTPEKMNQAAQDALGIRDA